MGAPPSVRYLGWVLGAAALGVAGYLGYVIYPRFDLPAGAGAGLLVLAAGAGIASFFSPCSFPLLVSMLARPLASATAESRRPLAQAAGFAAALSAGATAFLAVTGALLAAGAGTVFEGVTFTSTTGRVLRGAIGVLLVVLGLVQTNRIPVDFRRFEPRLHSLLRRQAGVRRRHPVAGFAAFGFLYLLAGFG